MWTLSLSAECVTFTSFALLSQVLGMLHNDVGNYWNSVLIRHVYDSQCFNSVCQENSFLGIIWLLNKSIICVLRKYIVWLHLIWTRINFVLYEERSYYRWTQVKKGDWTECITMNIEGPSSNGAQLQTSSLEKCKIEESLVPSFGPND